MKRTLLAVLLTAGTLVSAQSFAVTPEPFYNNGDENDTSWIYKSPAAKQFPADSGKAAVAIPMPHRYDVDDTSWEYQPPTAKQFPAASGKPASVLANIPHTGDEDNLSWLYVAPTAHAFNESNTMQAAAPSAPAKN